MIGKRGSDLVVRSAHIMISEVLADHLRARLAIDDDHQLGIVVTFLTSALIGLLRWWLDKDMPHSAEEMYASFERLASQGIAPLADSTAPGGGRSGRRNAPRQR